MKTEKPGKIVTNEELQTVMSEHARALEKGEADYAHIKLYTTIAGRIVKSVQLDIEGAKLLGTPIFRRTRAFLAETEAQ